MSLLDEQFPTLQLTSQQLAQIKEWPLNKQYKLSITVEMTGKRMAEKWDIPSEEIGEGEAPRTGIVVGSFQIKDVQIDENNFEKEYAKRMSGNNQ